MKPPLPLALVATAALALTACDQAAKDAQTTVEKTGHAVEATAQGAQAVAEETNAAAADTAIATGEALETVTSEANQAAVATTEAVEAVAKEANAGVVDTAKAAGSVPMMACARMDLPAPDSPTIVSRSPAGKASCAFLRIVFPAEPPETTVMLKSLTSSASADRPL